MPQIDDSTSALEEFKALRAEILLRLQLRSQLLAVAFTLFGGASALISTKTVPPELLFVVPIVLTFIALEWSYHDLRIFDVASYIKHHLERRLGGLHWQHHLDETRQYRRLRVTAFAAFGIFVVASVLILACSLYQIGTLRARLGHWLYALYGLDIIAICGAAYSLSIRRVDTASSKTPKIEMT